MYDWYDLGKMRAINQKIWNDPVAFSEIILGITPHAGQITWLRSSNRRINILRPGNRWGKTMIAAVKHLWHCMCKPNLYGKYNKREDWMTIPYQTLNFGPTYELGRGALQLARDIAQGNLLLPTGSTNKSVLKDWAITNDRADAQVLPYLEFKNGSRLLGRSYSDMGVAFKMKALAYVSGDECADIDELWTFTNNTLLMRVADLNGRIDLVGTPQPNGHDYMRMIEMAEADMKRSDWKEKGLFYTQRGSVYENDYISKIALEEIERVSDPLMREQIIRGEYVEIGEKYFGFSRIQNAVDHNIDLLEHGIPGRHYITGCDFAGGESAWADFTVIMTVDYSKEPYKIVYFNRFKGGDMSIPSQYLLVEDVVNRFPGKLILDSSALGGKNAYQFLGHLQPIPAEFGPTRSSTLKADMLAALKIAFDGGNTDLRRKLSQDTTGVWIDENVKWGLIRFPYIPALVTELQNYSLADTKLRTDCVMALAMIVYWLERRRPKVQRQQAVDMDFLSF